MNKDETKFKELYRAYSGDVFRFSYWLCRNRDRAKDITSETFTQVWLSDTETRFQTVKAYLFTIARNLFLQQERKNSRLTSINVKNGGTVTSAEKIAEERSELEHVLSALESLPETDRMALIMRAADGLSYEEIASATGLSVSAVKVKIFRARKKLSAIRNE